MFNKKNSAETYLERNICIQLDTIQTLKLGTIIQKFGTHHQQIKLDDGCIVKRHVNQLRKIGIPKRCISFAPSTKSEKDGDSGRQQGVVQLRS
jgi:hypothetical protein